jgi:hypothetical protein
MSKWPVGYRTAKSASEFLGIPYKKVLQWCRKNRVRREPQGWAISEAKLKKLAKDFS